MGAKGKQGTLGFGAKPKALTVPDIFTSLKKIADCKGNGSQQERVNLIKQLLVRAVDSESKFIIRHCQVRFYPRLLEFTLRFPHFSLPFLACSWFYLTFHHVFSRGSSGSACPTRLSWSHALTRSRRRL